MSDGIVRFSRCPEKFPNLKADGKNALYLGLSNIRNASRKQNFRKVNPEIYGTYFKNLDVFENYGVDVPRTIISQGCFHTNKHTIERQMNPEKKGDFLDYPTVENLSVFHQVVRVVFRKLKLEELPICDFEDVYTTEIDTEKKPGFRFEESLSARTKLEA